MKSPVKLCCPKCRGQLSDKITELVCIACQQRYPIIDGIPVFASVDQYYEGKFAKVKPGVGSSWKEFVYKTLHYFHYSEIFYFLQRIRGGVLLDLGCGGGTIPFARAAEQSVGIDLSLASVRNAAHYYDFVAQGDVTHLPFESDQFDWVVSSHVFGHVPNFAKSDLLAGIHRVLKPGGQSIHIIETDSKHPFIQYAKSKPELFKKHFVERHGHHGLELPSTVVCHFQQHGFEICHVKKLYAGLVPLWFYYIYFNNEYLAHDQSLRWKVELGRVAVRNTFLNLLTGTLQGLYEDSFGQWFTELDYSQALAVHVKKVVQ